MQNYFHNHVLTIDQEFSLNEEDNHHMLNVMRMTEGDELRVTDKDEHIYLVVIQTIQAKTPILKVIREIQSEAELPIDVTIASGLLKNDKMDWLLQKATETGMYDFIPLELQRNVVKLTEAKFDKRAERWRKIAKLAAQQSGRNHIPMIHSLMTLQDLSQNLDPYDYLVVLYEETAKEGRHHQLYEWSQQLKSGERLLVVFGPEGGFDPAEVDQLKKIDFKTMSLGPRILRAETAPIYLLSVLSYVLEIQ
ncbi:16S rRNA (uracil(1498)-N(3))-methyltransferase [Aerococcaceae bacterium DSM 111020]|nr:16S rRNA (uracil(1498)-N(3))-methyltransferase [Aerococcaceae bacterium DSM 111020]